MVTCLSISASSTILYYILKKEKENNFDYKQMIAAKLLMLIGTTNEQKKVNYTNESFQELAQETPSVKSKNNLIRMSTSFQNHLISPLIGNSSSNAKIHFIERRQKKWNRLIQVASFVAVVHLSRKIRQARKSSRTSI